MQTLKRYLGFVLVLAVITLGGCVLGYDYKTDEEAVWGIIGAFTCFGIGALLGWLLNRKHLLPE